MQTAINSIYTYLVNDGWSVSRDGIIRKNSRNIVPDSLKRSIATIFEDIDLAALINDSNVVEIYSGVVARYRTVMETVTSNQNVNDIEEINIRNYYPDRTPILNRRLHSFFKDNLVYTRDQNGTTVVLSRNGIDGNQWRIVNDMYSGIMMLESETHNEFKKIHTNVMQSPLNGATFEIYNGDGSTFGVGDWPKVVDIAVAKARKVVNENPTQYVMPSDASIKSLKSKRTFDENKDETILPPISVTCNTGLGGVLLSQWEAEGDLCVEMPTTITNDPNIPAFCYVDLDKFNDIKETPEFDGFMTSIDPAVRGPFMACLYACVFEPCHHSLVVWLHGEGSNGKSQLFSAINDYFGGNLVGSMSTKSLSGDFGLEGLIGKRIIIWGDCQNGNALSTNEVHGITGGDLLSVNRKNKPIIDYKFRSLLFIGANKPPEIKLNATNETRRVLYVPMSDPDEAVMRKYCEYDKATGKILRHSTGQPIFKSYDLKGKLKLEMPYIMAKCKLEFDKYCKPPYNQMTVPPEAFELMVNKCEGGQNLVFNDFIMTHFTITNNPNDFVTVMDVNSTYLEHVYGAKASKLLTKHNYELADLKRYILTSYPNIEYSRKRVDGNQPRVYLGMKRGRIDFTGNSVVRGFTEEENNDWM